MQTHIAAGHAAPEELAEAARRARRALTWDTAALLFTAAADALPADPHGNVTATEVGLRRDAYLCLNRTEQFKAHRERQRSKGPRTDFRDQWKSPTDELVKRLLNPHGRALVIAPSPASGGLQA